MAPLTSPDFTLLAPCFDRFTLLGSMNAASLPYSYLLQYENSTRQAVLYLVPKSHSPSIGWDHAFFERARAAMRLQHPNLLKVEDAGECLDYDYVLVEHSQDPDLTQATGLLPASPFVALESVKGLASGLQQAHAMGILHGAIDRLDIHINSRYFCRILPLNVRPGRWIPEEMACYAPEPLRSGRPAEPRDDTFSLGMILYDLLTGALPAQKGFVMPSVLGPCSREVDILVSMAISPGRSRRFDSMSFLIAAIDAALPHAERVKKQHMPGRKPIVVVDHGGTLTYFYLIPILMIAIVMAYVVLEYKQDLAALREKHRKLVEELVKDGSFIPEGTPDTPAPAPVPSPRAVREPSQPSAVPAGPVAPRPVPAKPSRSTEDEERGWSGE